MKRILAIIASIAFLAPGLASAQSYYDDYFGNYGVPSSYYTAPGQVTYYGYSPTNPEYGCNGEIGYTPCGGYDGYNSWYQPYTSYNYPQYSNSYYYPQTYMPQQSYYYMPSYAPSYSYQPTYSYPQNYAYNPSMWNNIMNTNSNVNNNNNTINISTGNNLYYIPGYGYYSW
jgi:hypothetical protein